MANRDTETPEQAAARIEGQPAPVSGQVVAAYESMLASVPEAGQDGFERILEVIAQAQDVSDLDAAWRSRGMEDLAGQRLEIRAISKMPSDFQSGLPWFLVVEAINTHNGERVTVTTGAVSVVAQLVRAWALGAIPGLQVVPMIAERPSKSGYYPQHLEIISKGRPAVSAEPQAEPATAGS